MQDQVTGELKTILEGAAFAPITDRASLRITGSDATRWLNGMVTNSIQALQPGEGNYNFLLNAQGRIQGDCTIYREPFAKEPTYILETDQTQLDVIQQLLDKFIIMDDVELTRGLLISNSTVTESPVGMVLIGPQAPELLTRLITARKGFATIDSPPAGTATPASFEGYELVVFAPPVQTVKRYEMWFQDRSVLKELFRLLDFHRVPEVSPENLEALRILEARPRYGTDIRNTDTAKDLPQETNQPHALHFAKGCYLGQEIVERIRSRGQVHRQLTPFRLDGPPPESFPIPLEVHGKQAGELTSAASISTTKGPVWLALGYARREFLELRTPFTYAMGTAHSRTPGQLT